VRPDLARELVYTGRVVEAEEAVRIGLATRASEDPLTDALALARTIAAQSPAAVRAGKRLCSRAPQLPLAEALRLETELQLGLLGTPEQMEAAQAAMMGRPAVFAP
jgi:enoyl-CoA hydratase/carnithine racemase